jgi:hypothetical protein
MVRTFLGSDLQRCGKSYYVTVIYSSSHHTRPATRQKPSQYVSRHIPQTADVFLNKKPARSSPLVIGSVCWWKLRGRRWCCRRTSALFPFAETPSSQMLISSASTLPMPALFLSLSTLNSTDSPHHPPLPQKKFSAQSLSKTLPTSVCSCALPNHLYANDGPCSLQNSPMQTFLT